MEIIGRGWNKIESDGFPWVRTIDKIMSPLAMPQFHSKLCIISDYAGDSKSSLYDVFSFLVFDWDTAAEWNSNRERIRASALRDERRVGFKELNDQRCRNALVPFLCNAHNLNGVSINFIISKRLGSLHFLDAKRKDIMQEFGLKERWKPKFLEKALRFAHFNSILIAGFSHTGQSVFCISDEDNVFANPGYSQEIANLLSMFTQLYVRHPLSEKYVATTDMENTTGSLLLFEDLAVIPDLVAGALNEISINIARLNNGHIPMGLGIPLNNLNYKTEIFQIG